MYVRITLLKTQIDEENIFVGASLYDMYNKLRALTDKKEYIGSFNPNDPFRIGLNYFLLDRKFNYAIFEFSDTLEAFENRDIVGNEGLTRFYFIRGFEFVNDEVTRLIVKEDIISRYFYPINKGLKKCIPSKFTYDINILNKKNYSAVTNSALFNLETEISFKRPITVPSEGENIPDEIKGKTIGFGAYVITYIDNSPAIEESGEINTSFYTENGVNYPFKNAVIPFCYNVITNEIIEIPFFVGGYSVDQVSARKIISMEEAVLFFKQTTGGFSVVSSVAIDNMETLGFSPYYYKMPLFNTKCVVFIANDEIVNYSVSLLKTEEEEEKRLYFLGIINFSTRKANGELNDIFKKEIVLSDEIPSILAVSPYIKLTVELCGQKIEIDPRILKIANDRKITFSMFQSLVPSYILTVDFLYDSDDITRLNYSNRGCFKLENSNSFMSFLDTYTEWVRTNYNAKITGLSVQQSNQNAILASQQASEQAALSRQIEANFDTAGVNAVTGVLGSVAGTVGGLMIASPTTLMNPLQNVGAGLSAIGGLANTEISAGAQRDVQGITQAQQREALSLNHQKERAILDLQLQDLRNTPDQISISNSAQLFLDSRAYVRVSLWINEKIEEIIFNHKIYGYSAPEMIDNLKSRAVFDYIRTNNIIFQSDQAENFYPSTADMLIIQDTFSKGVRVWYDLDKIKDYDNITQ